MSFNAARLEESGGKLEIEKGPFGGNVFEVSKYLGTSSPSLRSGLNPRLNADHRQMHQHIFTSKDYAIKGGVANSL